MQTNNLLWFREPYYPAIGTSFKWAAAFSYFWGITLDLRTSVEDVCRILLWILWHSLRTPSLAVFISYLSAKKVASSTILTYVSTLSYVHKLGNFPDPSKKFLVQKLLVHRALHSSPDVRLPITRSVLHLLVLALDNTNSSAFQRLTYQTMFLVAFYGFFRNGELTAKSANLSPLLQIRDLHFRFNQNLVTSATIVIKNFKHNTNRRPFPVVLECAEGTELCPVSYLYRYSGVIRYSLGCWKGLIRYTNSSPWPLEIRRI